MLRLFILLIILTGLTQCWAHHPAVGIWPNFAEDDDEAWLLLGAAGVALSASGSSIDLFLIGVNGTNNLYVSSDGLAWSSQTTSGLTLPLQTIVNIGSTLVGTTKISNNPLFTSTDGGVTWVASTTATATSTEYFNELLTCGPSIFSFKISLSNIDIYQSSDGTNWNHQGTIAGVNAIDGVACKDENNLLIGLPTALAIRYSSNGGANWTDAGGLAISTANSFRFAWAAGSDNVAMVYFDSGSITAITSSDNGHNFSGAQTYLGGGDTFTGALLSHSSGVYAAFFDAGGTNHVRAYRGTATSASGWIDVGSAGFGSDICTFSGAAVSGSTFVFTGVNNSASNSGIAFVSVDGGTSWTDQTSSLPGTNTILGLSHVSY